MSLPKNTPTKKKKKMFKRMSAILGLHGCIPIELLVSKYFGKSICLIFFFNITTTLEKRSLGTPFWRIYFFFVFVNCGGVSYYGRRSDVTFLPGARIRTTPKKYVFRTNVSILYVWCANRGCPPKHDGGKKKNNRWQKKNRLCAVGATSHTRKSSVILI